MHNQLLLLEVSCTISIKLYTNYSSYKHTYIPVAEPSMLVTCTVKLVDNGLLRTSTACASSSCSLTLYFDWPNITMVARRQRYSY